MQLRKHSILLCCAVFVFFSPVCKAKDIIFPSASLTIATHEKIVPFTVELATNEEQREFGLMYRKSLAENHGMLFDFFSPQHIDMWMKNTLIPLDMIFIDNHGVVTQIVENAVPESTTIIASDADPRAVLEVAGGSAAHYHIAKGDKVLYSGFQ